MAKRTLKEILVSDYSFNRASLKWIPGGSQLMEYIGQEVVFVDYKRADAESQWEIDIKRALIQTIHDFEPLTGTYEIIFSLIGEGENGEDLLQRERVIPEGFSYNNPDESNWMHRFVPYSLHFKMGETEVMFMRLQKLFETRPGMTIAEIKHLQTEDPKKTLEFFNNVRAVIDTNVEGGLGIGILTFRITEITEPKLLSKTWRFGIYDKERNYFPIKIERANEEETVIKGWTLGYEVIGDLKIMDIADQTKAAPYVPEISEESGETESEEKTEE